MPRCNFADSSAEIQGGRVRLITDNSERRIATQGVRGKAEEGKEKIMSPRKGLKRERGAGGAAGR